MAFGDLPIIDKASKMNDLSEKRLEAELNQQSGFICRPDVPDKGCDYDVELIVNNSATNQRFALQLKSIEKLNLIMDNQYISYPLETSRLGYLIRRLPAMGIIVLYSVEEDKLYFDYIDKIYQRLMEEREDEGWKQNDKVNIRIPITNFLDQSSVTEVHKIFERRFNNAATMQASQGAKYDLPTIDLSTEFKYDFHSLDHVKKLLKEFGMFMLGRHELQIIYALIEKVPNSDIKSDKDLLIVAAITYGELGMHSDSDFYVGKVLKRQDLNKEEKQTVSFAKLKNDLALGRISHQSFVDECRKILVEGSNNENEICIEININFYELIDAKGNGHINESLINSVKTTYEKIRQLNANIQTKLLLEVWNSENLSILISNIRQKIFLELRMRESMGYEFTVEEKKQRIFFLFGWQNQFFNIMHKTGKISKGI